MLALLLAELLGACGGGGGSEQSGMPMSGDSTVPPVPTQAWTGHYVGAVTIADATYFGDAVFTQDGAVRLYGGGPYDNDDSHGIVGRALLSRVPLRAAQALPLSAAIQPWPR